MERQLKAKYLLIIALIGFVAITGCNTLKQIQNSITNLKRCEFKLKNVDNFRVNGIRLSNKKSIKDFSITDGLKLTNAFAKKSFPAEFILNVEAKNPNDGTGGTKQSSATLTSFDWTLYIDDVPTVSGNIANPITIPGTGQASIIPLAIGLDLYEFFGKQGYDRMLNLALALGGANSSPAKITLDARPTISTPIGPISYPGRIKIVEKTWQ